MTVRLPARPRLLGASEAVETADGRVLLLAGSGVGEHVELEHAPPGTVELLRSLDGTRTLAQIEASGGAGLVRELTAAGLLDDAADDELTLSAAEVERYDRHLRYFATCVPAPRAATQAALRSATVAVLGLGGLGGMAALVLAACGVGHLVGVDGDAVQESNLARQILFRTRDVGARKAAVAARELRALNPWTRVTPVDRRLTSATGVADVIDGCDAVVAAIDWPAHRVSEMVDEACFAGGVPYIAMSQHPPLVRVGPLLVPGRTACGACAHRAELEAHPLLGDIGAAARDDSPAATYAPACGVIGALLANELIALLTGLHAPATLGRGWTFDLQSFASSWSPVRGGAGCPRCAGLRG